MRLELSILKRLSPSKSRPTVNFKQKSTQHKNFKLVLTNSSRSLGLKSLTRDFNFNLPAIFSHDSQASPILKLQSSNSLIFQTGLQFQKTLSIFMLILELRTSNNSEPVLRTSNNSTSDSNLKEDFRQLILRLEPETFNQFSSKPYLSRFGPRITSLRDSNFDLRANSNLVAPSFKAIKRIVQNRLKRHKRPQI